MPTKASRQKAPKRSLNQFVLDKKRATCPICALADGLREEIREAKEKKIARPVVLEWLQKEYQLQITSADLDRHYSARHESGER